MPQVLPLVTGIIGAIQTGFSGIFGGTFTPGPTTAGRTHTWPIVAHTREAFLTSVYGIADFTVQATAEIAQLRARAVFYCEHLAGLTEAEIAAKLGIDPNYETPDVPDDVADHVAEFERRRPGMLAEMLARGCYVRRVTNDCMDDVIGIDVAVVIDPHAEIRRGDLVSFTARGIPAVLIKAFGGRTGERLHFWYSNPRPTGYVLQAANVLHADGVVLVLPRSGEPYEPPVVELTHPLKTEPWLAPKGEKLDDVFYNVVLREIYETAASLPVEQGKAKQTQL